MEGLRYGWLETRRAIASWLLMQVFNVTPKGDRETVAAIGALAEAMHRAGLSERRPTR